MDLQLLVAPGILNLFCSSPTHSIFVIAYLQLFSSFTHMLFLHQKVNSISALLNLGWLWLLWQIEYSEVIPNLSEDWELPLPASWKSGTM